MRALGLEGGGVISLVGAGGKTSLMFALAREIVEDCMTVITTTTTKIYVPLQNESNYVGTSKSIKGILSLSRKRVKQYAHVTLAAGYNSDKQKLIGLSTESVDALWESGIFQWIVVEADGAAGRPLKAPAPHEPVIPESTRTLVAVSGLNALGKPLTDQWVFRPEIFSRLAGLEIGDQVTKHAIIDVLLNENGIMKGAPDHCGKIAFFNQAQTKDQLESGKMILNLLRTESKMRLKRAVLASLSDHPKIIDHIDL